MLYFKQEKKEILTEWVLPFQSFILRNANIFFYTFCTQNENSPSLPCKNLYNQ